MDGDNFVFCIYGFLRDMRPHKVDMGCVNKFVYVPKRRYEDNEKEITNEELQKRFGENSYIKAYDYNPKFFNDEVKKLKVSKFNKSFQQPQRILSFFNHIKRSLLLFKDNCKSHDDETIIYLFRSDMGIIDYNHAKATELLKNHDIVIEKFTGNGLRDFWFVLKKKNIDVFISLYDSYKKYLVNLQNNVQPKPPRETPESILNFHLQHSKMNVGAYPLIKFDWRHVCNEYCGHNKENTKILGEE
tara:strand:+ start:6444 stop:7175 length:732 start_codon:yes stop_codon:yes gene_type:complete